MLFDLRLCIKSNKMIYLTIFAGREKFLSILTIYLDILLERGLVDEIHVWDFIRNESDRSYVQTMCEKKGYRLMIPHYPVKTEHKWQPYYKYYLECSTITDNDIIIKCDDDIVYIDVDKFEYFTKQVQGDSIFFPNIYNNDVGAYWQNEYGAHDFIKKIPVTLEQSRGCQTPLTGWFKNWWIGITIHRFFLDHTKRCILETMDIKDWDSHVFINFFATTAKYFRKCVALYSNCDFDDEICISANSCVRLGTTNKIVLGFSVVHYSFGPQNIGTEFDHYLVRYKELSNSFSHNRLPGNDHIPATLQNIQNNCRNLSYHDFIPVNHKNYLIKLKESGFEPKVIYDIGSCVLHWTKFAKTLWPNAKYILFDAWSVAEFLYREGQFDYHMGILSDEDNLVKKFYQHEYFPHGSSYYKEIGTDNSAIIFTDANAKEMTTKKLDTVVKERGFPLPDFVKIDVQGAEIDIIRGGMETLKNTKRLIVELQHEQYNKGALLTNESLPIIESLGWKCDAPLFQNNGPDGDYSFIPI